MKKSKLLALLLALVMVFSLTVPAMAIEAPGAGTDLTGTLVILHTNDTHGADLAVDGKSIGTAGVAQLKKDYEAAGAEVLLFSAGDAIQGTPLVNLSMGATAIEFMNAAGYDAMTPGNHEFDWGYENLKNLAAGMEFPMLCANILDVTTQKPVFETSRIFETALGKVGVFGLDTPETLTKSHPDKVKGITFLMEKELFDCAQAQVNKLKAAGCDLIVCLGHLGIDDESAGNRSIDLLAKVTGIDLFIDGHSHSVLDGNATENQINGAMLVSTGTALANVGVVCYKNKTLTAGLISAAGYTGADADVAALVETTNTAVDAQLSEKFAVTEVLLDGNRAPGVRTQETNLGDFATDALLWAAREALGADAVDAAITNGGGIRTSIQIGNVTMKDMKTVFPFGNTVAIVTLTGAQLLEGLEAATCSTPAAIGAFPQVSGITFTIDATVEYVNGEMYPDSTYYSPENPGARVTNVTVGGQALDLSKTYVVATNDFTAAGGDTYYVFKDKPVYNTYVAMEDALVNYTAQVLGGVIGAKYAAPAGRITVISNPFADVSFSNWYYNAVISSYKGGLVAGVSGDRYGVDAPFSVASYLTVLYRMGKDTYEEKATTGANWDEAAKYFNETFNFGFKDLNAAITRQEMAFVAAVYLDAFCETTNMAPIAINEPVTFTDAADISARYAEFVTWFQTVGGINGISNGDGTFRYDPAATTTRGEAAQVIYNLNQVVQLVDASAAAS